MVTAYRRHRMYVHAQDMQTRRAAILARLREPSSKVAAAVLLSLWIPPEYTGPAVDALAALLALWAIYTPEGAA